MKKDIHPDTYKYVVFQDTGADFAFLTRSTATSDETIKWTDGKEYPLIKMHVSSASHPFYTGEQKVLDIAGRVDKFNARKKAADKAAEARTGAAKKALDRTEKKQEAAEAKKIGDKSPTSKKPAKKQDEKPVETEATAAA